MSPLRNGLIRKVVQPAVARLMGNPFPVDNRLGHTQGSIALYLPGKGALIAS